MITDREIQLPRLPGRQPRNLYKSPMPFVAQHDLVRSPIQELGDQDEPRRTMNFSGLGETPATAVPVGAPAPAAKPALPGWMKWAGLAGAAALVLWWLKKKGR